MKDRNAVWAGTMLGTTAAELDLVLSHESGHLPVDSRVASREERERVEAEVLAGGATRSSGAGHRGRDEEPDRFRTCFERDRDRVLHSTAFRRLAGKTQVFVHPEDHQRTRLTHAIEVAQVADAIGRAVGLNPALLAAMSYAHDVGHTPGGHAGETALEVFVPGFHHAIWGADVVLAPLNLCVETLDGVRCHSWSLPSPSTPEGHVLSWADRIAYCTHDFEDAVRAGIVAPDELPEIVVDVAGRTRSQQLGTFIDALIAGVTSHGQVGMASEPARALAALRAFNYERIYMRADSVAQGDAVIAVLRALVEYFAANAGRIPNRSGEPDPLRAAVTYVAGMTDRFAFQAAVELLGWHTERLPRGVDSPYAGLAEIPRCW